MVVCRLLVFVFGFTLLREVCLLILLVYSGCLLLAGVVVLCLISISVVYLLCDGWMDVVLVLRCVG